MTAFSDLGLAPALLRAVEEQGYKTATAIQAAAIPVVLTGQDLLAAAQTGTGKTAGFTLPVLQRLSAGVRASGNGVRALVLTPTRELAAQVGESASLYGAHLPLKSAVVFGGVSINPQMMRLRGGLDLLVATPGRLLDLYQQNALHFRQLEILVLDEADRMLDMGFIHDIKRILALLPAKRQTLLFSATFSAEIRALAKGLLRSPQEVSVTPQNAAASSVTQWWHPVEQREKARVLAELILQGQWHQALVFSRTKHGANKIALQLEKAGITAAAIHGNKSQGARTRALADFKQGTVQILVATDIAARGLDIDQLPQVVNFDLPQVAEDYVHRIGRTGRAGAVGQALSLVSSDEMGQLKAIEKLTGQRLEKRVAPAVTAISAAVTAADATESRPASPRPRGQARPSNANNGGNKSGGNRRGDESGATAKPANKGRSAQGAATGQAYAKSPRPAESRRPGSRTPSPRSGGRG